MDQMDKIPFLDLVSLHGELEPELVEVFRKALHTASFIGGPMLIDFERDFAGFTDTRHCVGVSSGTDALRFALMGAGVRPGDTVVTVPNSFIATTEAISQAGARFDFVDVDDRTWNMDPRKLEEYLLDDCYFDRRTARITSRRTGGPVTAVVPVHLYGQSADMDAIIDLADAHQLMVVEDACQAHGAEYFSTKSNRWQKAGSMGVAAAFSFYPGKNLGALGEAGAITTDRDDIAEMARKLRQHGEPMRYHHDVEGYNGRLDAIQAGFLNVKLRYLSGWVEARRAAASRYQSLLSPYTDRMQLPYQPDWALAAWHLYVVAVQNRDQVQQNLAEAGIGTGIHYPIPLHLQQAYRHLGFRKGDFPVAESAAERILSLPMFPQLTGEQQQRIARSLSAFFESSSVTGNLSPASKS